MATQRGPGQGQSKVQAAGRQQQQQQGDAAAMAGVGAFPFPPYFSKVVHPLFHEMHVKGNTPDDRIAIICEVGERVLATLLRWFVRWLKECLRPYCDGL